MLPFCTLYMNFLLFTIRKYTYFIWNRNIFPLKTFPCGLIRLPSAFGLCSCAEASSSRLLIPLVHTFALIHLFGIHDFSRRTNGILSQCANLWQPYYASNMLFSISGCFLRLYVLLDFSDIAIFGFSRSSTLHSSIWALYIIYLYLYTRAYTRKNSPLYKALIINII